MSSQRAKRFLHKLGSKLIAAAMILLGSVFLIDLSLRPIIESVSAYKCHSTVSGMINTAVSEELERAGTGYSQLVELVTNDHGEVTSIESNVMNINRLKVNIGSRISREMKRLSTIDINIPAGTLTGIKLLSGKGFDVGMTIQPVSYASTSIISEFSEAGINQTRHRIIIEIQANMHAVIPGFTSEVSVKTSVVAAETVIVGRVPEAYTHVITSDSELAGYLQDYGAAF